MADCGTYAGYAAHVKAGESTCHPCRRAASDYARAWRAKRPAEAAAHDKAQRALKDRALRILGQRHPNELRGIMSDLAKAALTTKETP